MNAITYTQTRSPPKKKICQPKLPTKKDTTSKLKQPCYCWRVDSYEF